jgi:hypothetical protein
MMEFFWSVSFMQMQMPLLFLKPMDQSRHGVPQILEAQHPLPEGAFVPP